MTGSGRERRSEKFSNLYFAKEYCWGDDVREEETDLHAILNGEMKSDYWVLIGNPRKRERSQKFGIILKWMLKEERVKKCVVHVNTEPNVVYLHHKPTYLHFHICYVQSHFIAPHQHVSHLTLPSSGCLTTRIQLIYSSSTICKN